MSHRSKTALFLGLFILISFFFSFYKINEVPPCINADEAAFGYNAYSILKTGKDEYGNFMPMRLVSFRDYKFPLYSYLSIPFIALFGFNDFSTRFLNIVIAAFFVPLMYGLAKELFNSKKISYIAAFLISISPWVYILTRHAHEAPLSAFFIILSIYCLIRLNKTKKLKFLPLANISLLLAAFSYHSARLFVIVLVSYQFFWLLKRSRQIISKKRLFSLLLLFFVLVIPFAFDWRYGASRITNLLFFKNSGYAARITEYLGEHPNRIIHNKLTESAREVSFRYLSHFSPEFLVINGDHNWRFGFQYLGLLTPVEYFLVIAGLCYLFIRNEKNKYFIVALLLISPLPNALTWQEASLTRTYILIFPLLLCVAYGAHNIFNALQRNLSVGKRNLVYWTFGIIFFFYFYNSWDIYFNHYPKRAVIGRAWQCGYKELVDYVRQNYSKYDRFVITDRHGQPYIYFLYYMSIEPAVYQQQAKITGPDKYGFGQVDRYDKFIFKFKYDKNAKKTLYIGYPDEFNDVPYDPLQIKKIYFGNDEVFWIYET